MRARALPCQSRRKRRMFSPRTFRRTYELGARSARFTEQIGRTMGLITSLLQQLFESKTPSSRKRPERRKGIKSGTYWVEPNSVALAAGRGFNQAVSGESFYRDTLQKLTNGETQFGVNVYVAAELLGGEHEGKPTLQVLVDGQRCGTIPQGDLQSLLVEAKALREAGKPLLAKGRISAGYDGGDYSVALSLSRPLRRVS